MFIVTGGAGFIGSNIVKGLNAQGHTDILLVDDLTDGTKYSNIVDSAIADYLDKDDFIEKVKAGYKFSKTIQAVIHQGACSTTTEWNGQYMLRNNFEYSKVLLHYCLPQKIPFIYASSAAVYGNNQIFKEDALYEKPVNVYGYSKLLFDQYVRRLLPNVKSSVVGLRYFNVYGPREQHKGSMASVAFHLHNQLLTGDTVKLFVGSGGYGPGEQRRDFIYVDDVVKVNLWFLAHTISGIYNVGTGYSQTFNEVAQAVIAWHKRGSIQYIPFPERLQGHYQSYTQADIARLREVGYQEKFNNVAEGVTLYLDWLQQGQKN